MSGVQARARFDLPSGTDAAEKLARSTNTDQKEITQYEKDDECPDDVRVAVYEALQAAFGETLDVWALLPRKVAHGPSYVSVTLVPATAAYLSEQEQEQAVADGPRQRLLATLEEHHRECQANMVAVQVLVAETEGDEATLHAELERLEQQGEVYQPEVGHYRLTGV
jgi:hypothetical protein